jgi:hypothetical protein
MAAAAGWFKLLHPTAAQDQEPLDFSAHAPQVLYLFLSLSRCISRLCIHSRRAAYPFVFLVTSTGARVVRRRHPDYPLP